MSESKQLQTAPGAQPLTRSDQRPTYSVSTWDHEIEQWHVRERRATQ